jgi:hypothetical protein
MCSVQAKKACFQQIPVEFAVLELIEAAQNVHKNGASREASASGSAHAVKWNCFQHKEPKPTSHCLVVLSIVHMHFDSTEVSSSSSQQTNLQVRLSFVCNRFASQASPVPHIEAKFGRAGRCCWRSPQHPFRANEPRAGRLYNAVRLTEMCVVNT